jgi:hypothetical protein
MTDSSDYRLYLEERFNGLNTSMNAHFMNVKDTLDSIKKDTGLTNSRVNHLEIDLQALEEKANKAIAYGNHVIDSRVTECPNLKRFEKLEVKMEGLESKLENDVNEARDEFRADSKVLKETLQDAMFFVRHPKMFVGIIVFFVLVSIYSIYESGHLRGILNSTKDDIEATKSEVQMTNDALIKGQTRGQYFDPFTKDTTK